MDTATIDREAYEYALEESRGDQTRMVVPYWRKRRELENPLKPQRVIDREKLAWAAGLFEGEGCIARQANREKKARGNYRVYVHPHMAIMMLDRDRIEQFHEIIGKDLGHFYQVNRKDRVGKPPFWSWQTSKHEDVQAVVAMLWHWLGPRRRARYIEIVTEQRRGPFDG